MFWKKVSILLLSSLLAMLAAEFLSRIVKPIQFRKPGTHTVGKEMLIHRKSTIRGLDFELKPDLDTYFLGVPVRTNELGMREPDQISEQPDQEFRVAVLGDSFVFGYGVAVENAFPELLEDHWNKRSPKSPVQVLNFGVTGYHTGNEEIVLREKVLPLKPNLILLGYVLNDPQFEPIWPLSAHFAEAAWWQHSNILRGFAQLSNEREVRHFGDGDYIRYLHQAPRVWAAAADAVEEIGKAAAEAGIPCLLLVFPVIPNSGESWKNYPYFEVHAQVMETSKNAGMEVLDLTNSLKVHGPAEIRLSEKDGHLNERGNRIVAEAIYEFLLQSRLAQKQFE